MPPSRAPTLSHPAAVRVHALAPRRSDVLGRRPLVPYWRDASHSLRRRARPWWWRLAWHQRRRCIATAAFWVEQVRARRASSPAQPRAAHCTSRAVQPKHIRPRRSVAGGVDVAQVLGREIEAASTQTSAALQRTQVRAWRARQPSPASGIRHHTTPRRIVPSLSPLARTAPPQLPWMLDRLRPSGVAVATLAWWHGLHRVNRVNRSTTYTPPGGAHSNLRY